MLLFEKMHSFYFDYFSFFNKSAVVNRIGECLLE